MNLMAFINRGVAASNPGKLQSDKARSRAAEIEAVANRCRAQWKNAILVDQTRGWLSLGDQQREVLTGLCSVLTLAGLCKAHDDGHANSAEVRVIRGAISAATQCAQHADYVLSESDIRALGAACARANDILDACSSASIIHAAAYLNAATKSEVDHAVVA